MTLTPNWRCQKLPLANLFCVVSLVLGLFLFQPVKSASAARTFYVSRTGNNGNGLSWGTAWNEMSQIDWDAVGPGDTILLDGGAVACPALGPGYNCGMVYNSTLKISRSGASSAPIVIRLAFEPGRNGTVIIEGGITAWSR